jgi:adenine-specific DNA methylase
MMLDTTLISAYLRRFDMASPQPRQTSLFDEDPRPKLHEGRAGIERRFDIGFIARQALKEKQIQQNVRPVIAVHKWFARRPGTLFRGLLLSEFADGPLREVFDRPHRFDGLRVADPFMGGGTPLFEANRLSCDVTGWDVNPMAYWVVRQEILHLDLAAYRVAAEDVAAELEAELGSLYRTRCTLCGQTGTPVKYFLWVKVETCRGCGRDFDLMPGYLLASDGRHPRNVLICSACGALNEVEDCDSPGECRECAAPLAVEGPAGRGRCACPHCGEPGTYPEPEAGPPRHRMLALEYHCLKCKPSHRGRFFKRPDEDDLARYAQATGHLAERADSLRAWIPDDPIPPGDETDRLHRWGYRRYREMFNARQVLGLGVLAEKIAATSCERVRHALATNLSDLLRYQNMLCRYDSRSLKSLDVFSVHGFPVGLIQAESNLLGIQDPSTGKNVGSGGWSKVVEKLSRAKAYCDEPFEIRYDGKRKQVVSVPGEWIGDRREEAPGRSVELRCGSSTESDLAPGSLDAVLTDPPYFANVQYAELMDFCHVWLRRLVGEDDPAFSGQGARRDGDISGNHTLERDLEHFVAGLAEVYGRMARALVPGRPLVFTYHHNELEAYRPVVVALLDAGLVCTTALPCPAEMVGSIHIHKSGSSIVDTVFVCRTTGRVPARHLGSDAESIARLVAGDLDSLREGGVAPTHGDARCIAYGHLARLAVWHLRSSWDRGASWQVKLQRAGERMAELASWQSILELLEASEPLASRTESSVREETDDMPRDVLRDVEICF